MESIDGSSGESEHGGKQGECRGHDQDDGSDGTDGEPSHEGQLEEEQAQERQDHRGAGKEDRSTRRGQGDADRLARVATFRQALPIPGDDEQGVVDADPKTDHRHDLGREHRGHEHVREQIKGSEGDGDAEQGGDDGQSHRHHRAKGQEHDDDGGEDADALTWAGLRPGDQPDGLPAHRHVEPRCGERLRRAHHVRDRGGRKVTCCFVELDADVGDVPIW